MVYITGDTHGDPERLSKSALKELEPGDTLIVCGDFGFIWDDSKAEQKILKAFSKRKYNICYYRIGNNFVSWCIGYYRMFR